MDNNIFAIWYNDFNSPGYLMYNINEDYTLKPTPLDKHFKCNNYTEAIRYAKANNIDVVFADFLEDPNVIYFRGEENVDYTVRNDKVYKFVNNNLVEIKEENEMKNTMEIGSMFHNTNGSDYLILAYDKDADIAIFYNNKNTFTPYVGAKTIREDCWGSGHYFKTLSEACDWFNKENGSEVPEEEDRTRADISITTEYDNGSGEYYSYKKSAMDKISSLIDEILEENPTAEIDILIDCNIK